MEPLLSSSNGHSVGQDKAQAMDNTCGQNCKRKHGFESEVSAGVTYTDHFYLLVRDEIFDVPSPHDNAAKKYGTSDTNLERHKSSNKCQGSLDDVLGSCHKDKVLITKI